MTLKAIGEPIWSFDVALTDEGAWRFALNTYGQADFGDHAYDTDDPPVPLHSLSYAEIPPRADVALEYAYSDPDPAEMMGGIVPVGLVVANKGDTPVDGLRVSLTGYETTDAPIKLAPGEKTVLFREVDVRQAPLKGNITATATCDGDSDAGNDSYDIALGVVDAVLSASQYKLGDTAMVSVELSNRSPVEASTTVTVRKNSVGGEVLDEKRFIANNRKSISMAYAFSADELGMGDDVAELWITAVTDEQDANLENNAARIPIYKAKKCATGGELAPVVWVPAEGVSILGDKARVFYRDGGGGGPENEGGEPRLAVEVYPSDATNGAVVWTSSDNDVVRVDNDGNLIFLSTGAAAVTATTYDGGFADSIMVMVKDSAYLLSVEETVGGIVTVNGEKPPEDGLWLAGGESAIMNAEPYPGYGFARWRLADPYSGSWENLWDDEKQAFDAVFTMPDGEAAVKAVFKLKDQKATLESIRTAGSFRTEYYEGETLDLSGLRVLADYDTDDGFVVDGYTTTPAADAALTKGDTRVTVSYTENGATKTTSFEITVDEAKLLSISVEPPAKTFYIEGDALDLDGLVVTGHYTNGSFEINGYTFDINPNEPLPAGKGKVWVSYAEGLATATASFDITVVKEIAINGVETGKNQATVYFGVNSADTKGYTVYLADLPAQDGDEIHFAPYGNVSFQKTGLIIKGLAANKNYVMYITYSAGGEVAAQSRPTLVPSNPLSITDSDGYYVITTPSELDAMRNNPAGKYRLYDDIDLSGYVSSKCTEANGWYPIGYGSPYFTGELDGQGHTISGLWSGKGWGISYKGLFSVTMGATIKDLNIELDERGITGGYEVGAIAGDARNGTVIEGCAVYGGQIVVTGGGYAGGLVGRVYGSPAVKIIDCTVIGTHTKTSGNYSGGLLGCALDKAWIVGCQTFDTISEGGSYIGGLVGALHGKASIEMSYSSGTVKANTSYAGGLAGAAYEASSITGGCSVASVSASYYAGGLVGTLYGDSTVSQSCAFGDVATKNYIAGGLVGEAVASKISDCFAQGDVKGTTGVGGLVGYFSGSGSSKNKSVKNCYSTGAATGTGTTEYGAFNGRSGVEYLGTNYFDSDAAVATRAYGTSGSPIGVASAYPQGQTATDMKKQATFAGWDFADVWGITEGETYPYLKIFG